MVADPDLGSAGKRHLEQHESVQPAGLDVYRRAVAQDEERQRAQIGAVQGRIDLAAIPAQFMLLERLAGLRARLMRIGGRKQRRLVVQMLQFSLEPSFHCSLRRFDSTSVRAQLMAPNGLKLHESD